MTTVSLSVEQTNALRKEMGLPPLTSNSPAPSASPSQPRPQSPPSPTSTSSLSDLRAELARRKQARKAAALLSTPTLSEQLQFSTAGSAAAWVQRSKSVMEEERKRAEERRKQQQDETERRKHERGSYDSAQLRGLRIAHDYDEFEGDEQRVLVLKDKKITEEGAEDDELINPEFEQQERLLKGKAAATGSRRSEEDDGVGRLLAKYDEEDEGKVGIVLGGGGTYGAAEEQERRRRAAEKEKEDRRRAGWEIGPVGAVTEYDVSTVDRRVKSEYKDVKFKRKKKPEQGKRAGKSKPSKDEPHSDDWLERLEEEARRRQQGELSNMAGQDERKKSAKEEEEERRERRTQGYLRALEKGEEETKRRIERDRLVEEEERRRRERMSAEMEDEDAELALAVARARRITQQQQATVKLKVEGQDEGRDVRLERVSGVRALAERIASERKESGVKHEGGDSAAAGERAKREDEDVGGIVFTSVSNFASGLMDAEDDVSMKRERRGRADAAEQETNKESAMQVDADDSKASMQAQDSKRHSGEAVKQDSGGEMQQLEVDRASVPKAEMAEDGDENEEDEDDEDEDGDEDEDEEDDVDILDEEPLASAGVASALELAKRRAYISPASSTSGAAGAASSSSGRSGGFNPSFNLARYDALGRELSAKEQFRLLSHAFHGQGAGINKLDKRVRRLQREVGVLRKVREKEAADDGIAKLMEAQRRRGQPYLVLDAAKTAITQPHDQQPPVRKRAKR